MIIKKKNRALLPQMVKTRNVSIAFFAMPDKYDKKYANYFGDYIDDIFEDLMGVFGGYFWKII